MEPHSKILPASAQLRTDWVSLWSFPKLDCTRVLSGWTQEFSSLFCAMQSMLNNVQLLTKIIWSALYGFSAQLTFTTWNMYIDVSECNHSYLVLLHESNTHLHDNHSSVTYLWNSNCTKNCEQLNNRMTVPVLSVLRLFLRRNSMCKKV